jgi:hypothetical protein
MRHPLFSVPLLAATSFSCLPADTRPVPAQVNVTASSSELLLGGIPSSAMEDGWSVAFERLLISIGDPHVGSPEERGCSAYSNPSYTRVFDMKAVMQPETIGISYARDQCSFSFRVSSPDQDSRFGAGATERDSEFMRTPARDVYASISGVSIYVTGTAARGSTIKRFAWAFRQRLQYDECWQQDGATRITGLDLRGGELVTVNIVIKAEALFQDQLDPMLAKLRFDVFAAADADEDGEVTLSELAEVPLSGIGAKDVYHGSDAGAQDTLDASCRSAEAPNGLRPISTLRDYVYCGLFPQLARFGGGGGCEVTAGDVHLQ